jgi:hypothetical protein
MRFLLLILLAAPVCADYEYNPFTDNFDISGSTSLAPGSPRYIQNSATAQTPAQFNVDSGKLETLNGRPLTDLTIQAANGSGGAGNGTNLFLKSGSGSGAGQAGGLWFTLGDYGGFPIGDFNFTPRDGYGIYGVLDFHDLTDIRRYTWPDKDGTVAMVDDITGGTLPLPAGATNYAQIRPDATLQTNTTTHVGIAIASSSTVKSGGLYVYDGGVLRMDKCASSDSIGILKMTVCGQDRITMNSQDAGTALRTSFNAQSGQAAIFEATGTNNDLVFNMTRDFFLRAGGNTYLTGRGVTQRIGIAHGAITPDAILDVRPSASETGLQLKGASSQTAAMLEIEDTNSVIRSSFGVNGSANFSNTVTVRSTSTLAFNDGDNSNFVALKASDIVSSNLTFTLPAADGSSGQVLSTNGNGVLSFATPSSGAPTWSVATSTALVNTLSLSDVFYQGSNASQITVHTPTASGNTGKVYIVNRLSAVQNVIVDPHLSETIAGASTYTLSSQYASVMFISDGTNWQILASHL